MLSTAPSGDEAVTLTECAASAAVPSSATIAEPDDEMTMRSALAAGVVVGVACPPDGGFGAVGSAFGAGAVHAARDTTSTAAHARTPRTFFMLGDFTAASLRLTAISATDGCARRRRPKVGLSP